MIVARRLVLPLAILALAACSGDDAATSTGARATEEIPASASAPTTDAIPASTPSPSPSSTAAADTTSSVAASTAPARVYDFSAIHPIVQQFVDEHGLNGAALVVVQRDDGIVDEEYWGEFTPARPSLVASSTKMITAGVLLRLQDEGLLDIDAPVADSVAWGAGNPDITVAELLSNSSGLVGLAGVDNDPRYGPYVCQFLPGGTLQDCAEQIFTTSGDDADVIAPDTQFRYGGAQWQVAGAVAEAVSGKSWAELIDETYVQPCGVDSLAYNNHWAQLPTGFEYPDAFAGDPSTLAATDNPNMEGGAYIDPPDYAALLLMHLRGGRCGDTQVLSQDALDTMHADRIGAVYGGQSMPGSGYGMGWWVDRATGRISDPGAFGAVPWLDLDAGYGAYLVIEDTNAVGVELAAQLFELVDDAVAAATG